MKRSYTITETTTDENGEVFEQRSKRFNIQPVGDLGDWEAASLDNCRSSDSVIRVNGELVDENAMTCVSKVTASIWHVFPKMECRLFVQNLKNPPKILVELLGYISDKTDIAMCKRMLDEPDEFPSDMGLLMLTQLPPWHRHKSRCHCHDPLTKAVFSATCQPCLKKEFKRIWIQRYTKRRILRN